MTNYRPYCVKCNVRMDIDKNEVEVPYSEAYIQYGDRYKCPECGVEIVMGFGVPMVKPR